jgi:NCAIR mutase (PurE)-related protein
MALPEVKHMDINSLRKLLESVKDGQVEIDEALTELKKLPFEDIGFAKIDHHRNIRNGYPEVIYCQGKTVEQIKVIVRKLMENGSNILATRAGRDVYDAIKEVAGDAVYHEAARIVVAEVRKISRSDKIIAVVSAGTSDIPVAEEAAVTAEALGNNVERIYDVGVAGITVCWQMWMS